MTADADALEAADAPEAPSPLGGPGVSWAGDGALAPGRPRERSALDSEVEEFPPILEEGDSGYPLATFNRRWVGFLIDRVVIVACATVVALLAGVLESGNAAATAGFALIVTLVELGYGGIFNPRGWSPGKLLVGVRIVNVDGEPPGLRWGTMRTAATVISQFLFWVGYFWAFFDKQTQTWHDKLAKTYVVRVDDSGPNAPNWRRS